MSGQGKTILVVEDDPGVRTFTTSGLEWLGYRVLEVADHNEAMCVLVEQGNNIDLLLSDIALPGGQSGPELAARARDLHPELKLIFMSGYAAGLYTHGKVPGFDEIILTKPFKLAELSTAVDDALAT